MLLFGHLHSAIPMGHPSVQFDEDMRSSGKGVPPRDKTFGAISGADGPSDERTLGENGVGGTKGPGAEAGSPPPPH